MEYTRSDAHGTHSSGRRMHQTDEPVCTEVSARDMNMLMWSLMAFLDEAGIAGATFDPDTPATYRKLYDAVFGRLGGAGGTQGVALLGANPAGSYPVGTAGAWLRTLADAVAALQGLASAGVLGYATKAAMNADLAHAAGTVAYVVTDPTPANNGVFLKLGASGAGSWTPSSGDRTTAVETRVSVVEGDLGGSVKQAADVGWWVVDAFARIALQVAADGRVTVGELEPLATLLGGLRTSEAGEPGSALWALQDAWGRQALRVDDDGSTTLARLVAPLAVVEQVQAEALQAGAVSTRVLRLDAGSATALPDILGFIAYGQSWTVGFDSQPALSTTQRFNNLMFNGGVRSQSISDDPAVVYTSLVPLVERDDAGTAGFPAYPCGETYCASQTDAFCERVAAENAQTVPLAGLQLFSSCPGEGSKRVEELSKGATYYTRLLTQVQYAFSLAQAAGKSFTVPAISWVQNTANAGFATDGGTAAYPALLEQMRVDLEADIRAITGQAEPLKLITWQMFPDNNTAANRADQVYARHVKTADTYAHIHCVGGSYFLDQDSTNPGAVHLTNESQRWLGAQLGLVAKRVVVDGVDWRPVQPLSVKKNGRVLTVRFHVPAGRLVWDTERVAAAVHYGFSAHTATAASGGGTELVISSVAIVNRDTVRIVLASAPPAGAVLRYASQGTQQGRLIGIRGNLRDTQGDAIRYQGLPLHNWCVCFEESIL